MSGRLGLPAQLPADFNHAGTVDYDVWRKTGGAPDDYAARQENFGRTHFTGIGSPFALRRPRAALINTIPERVSNLRKD
jgi:hypothetical protein